MNTTLTCSDNQGIIVGDTIIFDGEYYKVIDTVSSTTLHVRGFGWWDRFINSVFFQVVLWRPLRALRWADWMPETYYWEQECNEILKGERNDQ